MAIDLASPLFRSLAAAASTLDVPEDVDEILRLICRGAVDAVPGAVYAGITLTDRRGKLETPAASDPLIHRVDALQYEFRQGPCVDAVQGRRDARSENLRLDTRWPEYGPRAAGLGILSQMGIELFTGSGFTAGLNLYSSTVGAFDDDTVEAALLFAIQATHVLGRVMAHKQLADAMSADTTTGRATGMVMQRFGLTPDRAFELLTRVSRVHDITLETLAQQILAEVNDQGEPEPRSGSAEGVSPARLTARLEAPLAGSLTGDQLIAD